MQLMLFESVQSDTRPLPLIIAERYGFPLQCHEVDGKCWFAVQDWIAGVARTGEPRDFWYQLQKRLKKAGVELSILKQALGLAESANLRDALSSIALAYIRIAEQGIAQQLNDLPELISHEQCLVLIKRFAGIVGAQAKQTSLALGRDVFTGQKLIGQVQ